MSNARILADLMGTSTTVPSSKLSLVTGDMPSGSVLQVKQIEDNTVDSFSASATSTTPQFDAVSLSITPSSTSNKILVIGKATVGAAGTNYDFSLGLKRNGTLVGGNTNSSNFLGTNVMVSSIPSAESPGTAVFNYLDSPSSTSSVTYTIAVWGGENATYYINRGASVNSGRNWANSGGASLILMEIAG